MCRNIHEGPWWWCPWRGNTRDTGSSVRLWSPSYCKQRSVSYSPFIKLHWCQNSLYHNRLRPKAMWARQSVKLVGMGAKPFNEAVAGLVAIHQKFDGFYQAKALMPWVTDGVNEHFTLSFSNRYLMAAHLAQDQPHLDPDPIIDPMHILSRAAKEFGVYYDSLLRNRLLYLLLLFHWSQKVTWSANFPQSTLVVSSHDHVTYLWQATVLELCLFVSITTGTWLCWWLFKSRINRVCHIKGIIYYIFCFIC